MNETSRFVSKERSAQVLLAIFLVILAWWWWLNFATEDSSTHKRQLWAAVYQILSIYGAIAGLYISHKWGGFKSVLGRALSAFSLGLLFQSFGQSTYSYYIFFEKIDAPYPSIGDLGFFGSIPFYIYGAWQIAKVAGSKISLRTYGNQISAIIIPIAMLGFSYFAFLRGYEFDSAAKLLAFLDFGYPIGQAIYVSIAILVFFISQKTLGGKMRNPMLVLLFALVFQYISDSAFLYQASQGTYLVGGIIDLMYAISYLLMALSLIKIGHAFKEIRQSE